MEINSKLVKAVRAQVMSDKNISAAVSASAQFQLRNTPGIFSNLSFCIWRNHVYSERVLLSKSEKGKTVWALHFNIFTLLLHS
jgi:hypothetical protein